MASLQQIEANQQNAQLSSGPVSEIGKQISAKNSIKHGFTGKTLFLTDEEIESYRAHVAAYHAEYNPAGQKQTHLLQQLADLHWSLHQLAVEESNTLDLISALNAQARQQQLSPMEALDQLAKATRTLNTLGNYEGRKRRAAKATQEELQAVQKAAGDEFDEDLKNAAALYKTHKAKGQPFDPAEFGFVCTLADLDYYFQVQKAAAPPANYPITVPNDVVDPRIQKMLDDMNAENDQLEAEMAATLADLESRNTR
jgi:hypothetical protein